MRFLSKELKMLAVWGSLLVLFLTLLFIVSQVWQLYQLALGVSPVFGSVVLVTLIALAAALLATPLVIYFRLPPALIPPAAAHLVPAHRSRVLRRLQANTRLAQAGRRPDNDTEIEGAIAVLDEEANRIIRQTALSVFLTTSVSQNGRLDAFTVLFTHTRMVWKICHLYHQRPGLRDLAHLYANIGATTFLVSEIEDLDVSLRLESLLSGITKSASFGSIPVVGPTANLLVDSLFEGSTNAFLTLRVGVIARRYCGCLTAWDRKEARKAATVEAGKMLTQIVANGSQKVIAGVLKAAKNAGYQTLRTGGRAVAKAGARIGKGIASSARKINPFGSGRQQQGNEPQES